MDGPFPFAINAYTATAAKTDWNKLFFPFSIQPNQGRNNRGKNGRCSGTSNDTEHHAFAF